MDEDWRHRLKQAADQYDGSRKAASRRAGLSPSYLTHLLSGLIATPTIESLDRLCTELKVDMTYILTGQQMSEEAEQLLKIYYKMPPELQRLQLSYMEGLVETKLSDKGRSEATDDEPGVD